MGFPARIQIRSGRGSGLAECVGTGTESVATPRRIAAKGLAGGLAGLALAATASPAFGHAGERGFILLLPTGLFQAAGTAAVAVSFLVVIRFRGAALRRAIQSARWRLFPVPRWAVRRVDRRVAWRIPGSNAAASVVLLVLIAAGLAGSRDPLANPLPLTVWTLLWVGLTFVHAVLGNVWPLVNPWTALARPVRRVVFGGRSGRGRQSGDDAGGVPSRSGSSGWRKTGYPRSGDDTPGILHRSPSPSQRRSGRGDRSGGDEGGVPSRPGSSGWRTTGHPRSGDGAGGLLPWPDALGDWPAVVLLLLFAWFELVFPAPRDPAILAFAVAGYSLFTVAGMVLFGDAVWNRHVEIFSRFFRIVSWLAPLCTVEEGGRRRLVLTYPGARLPEVGALSAGNVVFVVVALATVSFDGLSRTFWWLDLAGENPLEHPGRTALVGRNTLGLVGAAAALLAAFAATAAAGAWWSGARPAPALRRFVVSIVPIAFGYHFAHYLPSFLVDAQYALKALSDPLALGWNLLGARDLHVTASFLTHHASVEIIWYAQAGAIVAAHVVAVVALHTLAGEGSRPGRLAPILGELPLTVLMIGYTLFGLWLLSTPVAA